MKKIVVLPLILSMIYYCKPDNQSIEKITENGSEIVINHHKPYKVKGESSTLLLEEEFTIDTERDEVAEIGVNDLEDFDVDSKGNIYFFQKRESDENLVYKFDKKGNFITKFGKRGQGPGEIEYPLYQYITQKDEIPIQDDNKLLLCIFDRNGTLINETRLGSKIGRNYLLYPLENGNYLAFELHVDRSTKHFMYLLFLFDSKFEKVMELDKCDFGKIAAFVQQKQKFTPRVFIYHVSNNRIYVGHEKRGYEILIFNLDGKLLKKIRKEFNPAGVPNEFKEFSRVNYENFKDKYIFPNIMPPFHYFFLDDEERLYVKTFEKGEEQNEYIHDIFTSEGVFIQRKSIAGYGKWVNPGLFLNRTKASNNRLYSIREKVSGYKELVVYKMNWE